MAETNITLATNQRVFSTGKTGSGKTTLAMFLLYSLKRLIVIDSKDELEEWQLENYSPSKLNTIKKDDSDFRLRVVNQADYIPLLESIYDNGNCYIYIDELTAVILNPAKVEPVFRDLYMRGRSRNIGVWSSTQRPTFVPLFTLSESEHIFTFRLNLPQDRKRMSETMGSEGFKVEEPIVDKYGFWYYNLIDDKLFYYKRLNLDKLTKVKIRDK